MTGGDPPGRLIGAGRAAVLQRMIDGQRPVEGKS
jgi:hypothetical protein